MKLEVEITEDEIRSAIERKIRVAVAEYSDRYGMDRDIKDMIQKNWGVIAEKIIVEELANSGKLRERIRTILENKIKAQLQAVMNKTKV